MFLLWKGKPKLGGGGTPEHGDEQVEQQDVGDQQVDGQQDEDEPVGFRLRTRFGSLLDQSHVVGANFLNTPIS